MVQEEAHLPKNLQELSLCNLRPQLNRLEKQKTDDDIKFLL